MDSKGARAGLIAALLGTFIFGIAIFSFVLVDFSFVLFVPVIFMTVLFFVVFLSRNVMSGAIDDKLKIKTICPSCKEEIDVDSEFCNHCGKPVNEEVICEYCGASNSTEDSVCKTCNAFIK